MAIFRRDPPPLNWGNKRLSCRREAERYFLSFNISLSHSRSLKVIRNNTLEYGVCKSLLAFHYKCFYLSHSIAQQQLVIVQPIISLAAFDDEGR